MVKKVEGWKPTLPSSDQKITKAVAGNWVLPMFDEVGPLEKPEPPPVGEPKEKKPPLQKVGVCDRCLGPMYFREGWKAVRCFSCSGE